MSRRNDAAARAAATTFRAEPFTDEELDAPAPPRLRAPVAERIDPDTRFGLTAKGRAHLAAGDLDRLLAQARGRR